MRSLEDMFQDLMRIDGLPPTPDQIEGSRKLFFAGAFAFHAGVACAGSAEEGCETLKAFEEELGEFYEDLKHRVREMN